MAGVETPLPGLHDEEFVDEFEVADGDIDEVVGGGMGGMPNDPEMQEAQT